MWKHRILALAHLDVLRAAVVIKAEFGFGESDIVCSGRRIVCGDDDGISVVTDKPLDREIISHAERDSDRLLPFCLFFCVIIFDSNHRGYHEDAVGNAGGSGDAETAGRGDFRVGIAVVGTAFTVGFRVGEGKGDAVDGNVRARKT